MKYLTLALLGASLCGCWLDDPPCPTAKAAHVAALAYEQCILTNQRGDGGADCGTRVYDTFCRGKPND